MPLYAPTYARLDRSSQTAGEKKARPEADFWAILTQLFRAYI